VSPHAARLIQARDRVERVGCGECRATLLERIDGTGPEERVHIVPTRLVPRGSGEIAPPG
jgi:hypothetical protein